MEKQPASGIELLVEQSLQSYVQLPLLEVIYDRFLRESANSLRTFTSDTVDVDIVESSVKQFGEVIGALPNPSMIVLFKVIEWDNYGLLIVNSAMIYTFVELLFGGRKTKSNLKVEGRPFTSIEINVIKSIAEIILTDLTRSFEGVVPATFQLDHIETNPRFTMICRPEDVTAILKLKIAMEGRSGEIDILLPYSTLEPAKKVLSRSYIVGERGGKDPQWVRHFENEISKVKVKLEVRLTSIATNLSEIAHLTVGKTILLDKLADADWDLRVNHLKVATGKSGRVGDKLALRLNEGINVTRYKE